MQDVFFSKSFVVAEMKQMLECMKQIYVYASAFNY